MISLLCACALFISSASQAQECAPNADRLSIHIESFSQALLFRFIETVDFNSATLELAENLKHYYATKIPTTNCESILAFASYNTDKTVTFGMQKDNEGNVLSGSIATLPLLEILLHREIVAFIYELLFEKSRHMYFYETNNTIEQLFPDPVAFREGYTAYTYYNLNGNEKKMVLPSSCIPTWLKTTLTNYVQNLRDNQLVASIDGIKSHTLCMLAQIGAQPIIKPEYGIAVATVHDKDDNKHRCMIIVVKKNEEESFMVTTLTSILGTETGMLKAQLCDTLQ